MEDFCLTPKKMTYRAEKTQQEIKDNHAVWEGIDVKNQGIKNLSMHIFDFEFITFLEVDNNELTYLHSNIGKLRNLRRLSLRNNKLKSLPSEIGKLTHLRELDISLNQISTLPIEIGNLYKLEKFECADNPWIEPCITFYNTNNMLGIINFYKERRTTYKGPADRQWIIIDDNDQRYITKDSLMKNAPLSFTTDASYSFTLGTYNILLDRYAKPKFYKYVPSWVLKWEMRRDLILNEISHLSFDILCLQEISTNAFSTYFRDRLDERCNYDSLFYPKSIAKRMGSASGLADGCATFWKRKSFSLIEHRCVEFTKLILADKRFNDNNDIVNRNMNKDNIALITVLKGRECVIIVINTHITWDPDYKDVKLMQIIVLVEEIQKIKSKYSSAGVILSGDLNSLYDSDVYKLLMTGKVNGNIEDFSGFNYYPFTTHGFYHNLNLKDSYIKRSDDHTRDSDCSDSSFIEEDEPILNHTTYTPNFTGVIDYILHNDKIRCLSVLDGIDEDYCDRVPGFPSVHIPSDHIIIGGKYCYSEAINKRNKK